MEIIRLDYLAIFSLKTRQTHSCYTQISPYLWPKIINHQLGRTNLGNSLPTLNKLSRYLHIPKISATQLWLAFSLANALHMHTVTKKRSGARWLVCIVVGQIVKKHCLKIWIATLMLLFDPRSHDMGLVGRTGISAGLGLCR